MCASCGWPTCPVDGGCLSSRHCFGAQQAAPTPCLQPRRSGRPHGCCPGGGQALLPCPLPWNPPSWVFCAVREQRSPPEAAGGFSNARGPSVLAKSAAGSLSVACGLYCPEPHLLQPKSVSGCRPSTSGLESGGLCAKVFRGGCVLTACGRVFPRSLRRRRAWEGRDYLQMKQEFLAQASSFTPPERPLLCLGFRKLARGS